MIAVVRLHCFRFALWRPFTKSCSFSKLQCIESRSKIGQKVFQGFLFFHCQSFAGGVQANHLGIHLDTQFGQNLVGHKFCLLFHFLVVEGIHQRVVHQLLLDFHSFVFLLELLQNLHGVLDIHCLVGCFHCIADATNRRCRRDLGGHGGCVHSHGTNLGLCRHDFFPLFSGLNQLFRQGGERRIFSIVCELCPLLEFLCDLFFLSVEFTHFPIHASLGSPNFPSCLSFGLLGQFLWRLFRRKWIVCFN
mmetsp:Transcript_18841/g.46769  ORF Transcript_18841/g.46769 Transcript_18841/m.46769 type:complete len:248 (+) Transcript_18841:82-825(+)